MITDPNWKPPEGMYIVPWYPDGCTPVPVVGLARIGADLIFDVGANHERAPALPLRLSGEHEELGWDIPTRWAIDAKGKCYMDNAHGGEMSLVPSSQLLKALSSDERDTNGARKALGLKPAFPRWMATALAAGWAPPPTFKREDYEDKDK